MANYTKRKVPGSSVNAPNKEVYAIYLDGKPLTKTAKNGTVHFKWASSPERAQDIINRLEKAQTKAASGAGAKKKTSSSSKASAPKARMSLADCRKLLESKGYEVTKGAEEEEEDIAYMMAEEMGMVSNPRRRRRRR